jgi:hypothetical protein
MLPPRFRIPSLLLLRIVDTGRGDEEENERSSSGSLSEHLVTRIGDSGARVHSETGEARLDFK